MFKLSRKCILFFVLLPCCGPKQGCIDPGSENYNSEAIVDNESCTYREYSEIPAKLAKLGNLFEENSGLKFSENRIWTIIDKVKENKAYSINLSNGDKQEEIVLDKVTGVNFEAISASPSHFFIGDIGNNDGNRTDLVIYKFPKPANIENSSETVSEKIKFTYSDQFDFTKNTLTNFDCEAMFYFNDYLYLFTKNNENNKTNLYKVPATAGNHEATPTGIFNVKGLITDADISPDGTTVALIGHDPDNLENFIWIITDYPEDKFFLGKKIKANIGPFSILGQVEGITFVDNNNVFISNELYKSVEPTLYSLDLSGLK